MRALICHDDGQLRRVETAIAAIQAAPQCFRATKSSLLTALEAERAELLRYAHRRRTKANSRARQLAA